MDTTRSSLLLRVKDPADASAWTEFDRIYRPMLFRFARARGLDIASAEEMAQQCMTEVCTHIRSFDYDPARGRFRSWLRTMVNNRVRNLLRDRREQQANTRDLRQAIEPCGSPEELFDRLWQEEHLRYCLALVRQEIEDSTYRAFRHYVLDEWPVERVCETHKMNPAQVHAIKWRVTRMVGARMKELVGDSA